MVRTCHFCLEMGWAPAGGEHCITHQLLLLSLTVAVVVVLLLLYFTLFNLLNCSYLSHRKFYIFSLCFSSPSHLAEGQVLWHGMVLSWWLGLKHDSELTAQLSHLPTICCIRIRAQVPQLPQPYSPLLDAELYTGRWRPLADVQAGKDTNTPSEGGYMAKGSKRTIKIISSLWKKI